MCVTCMSSFAKERKTRTNLLMKGLGSDIGTRVTLINTCKDGYSYSLVYG